VVQNGIDLARYPFRAEKEDFLLFLGRAAPEKGLLEAVRTARAAGSRLVIALKDPQSDERSFWERKVVPELGPDTVVWGELSFEVKADLLSRARAVLFPIDWDEPFGLVMIEAMACGTPVIATDRAAVPEIVDDGATGFIVPARSFVAHAAEAVRALVSIDPQACRRRVERDFTAARMVDSYADLYRSTLTRVRGGASSTSSA
jgi:glycosyltransferase involved in cell wall biosynthesis